MKNIILQENPKEVLSTFASALAENTSTRVTIGNDRTMSEIARKDRYDSYVTNVILGDPEFLKEAQDIATLTISSEEAVEIGVLTGFVNQTLTSIPQNQIRNQTYQKLVRLIQLFPNSRIFRKFNKYKYFDP